MGVDEANALEKIIDKAENWPVWSGDFAGGIDTGAAPKVGMYGQTAKSIELFVALRESDRNRIEGLIEWDKADPVTGKKKGRRYRVDPLSERISQAFSDLLFGDDPKWKAADKKDEDRLTELLEENDLGSELRSAAADASSEGEVWWRIYNDPSESDFPMVEFVSRLDVIPLFRGRKIAACAFVWLLYTQEIQVEGQAQTAYWRHIEIQTDGETRNLLYKGTVSSLGSSEPLEAKEETKTLEENWKHGLKMMLAGRILNKRGRDFRLGISDYQGIQDMLLDLNEVRVIMAENARMTGKKKMVVPAGAVDDDGTVDLGADIIVDDGEEEYGDGGGKSGAYAVLEYTFDANELIAYKDDLVVDALTRVGLAQQFVGGKGAHEGTAESGTALKTRFIPTTLAGSGKGRYWDNEAPTIALGLQQVDALDVKSGGCGGAWTKPDEAPVFKRGSVLPEDPKEAVDLHVAAVGGEVESVETAVRELNPDWDDQQIAQELQRIKEDRDVYGINPDKQPGDEGEKDKGGKDKKTPAEIAAEAAADEEDIPAE